ncbi:hypothetical protein AX16_010754 [Volvariella volvacea WC 439]|nr:hypothetical protein AX16_010754 [Volvariella volvacea WC 439]
MLAGSRFRPSSSPYIFSNLRYAVLCLFLLATGDHLGARSRLRLPMSLWPPARKSNVRSSADSRRKNLLELAVVGHNSSSGSSSSSGGQSSQQAEAYVTPSPTNPSTNHPTETGPSSTSPGTPSEGNRVPAGPIAGGVVGGMFFLIISILLLHRRRRRLNNSRIRIPSSPVLPEVEPFITPPPIRTTTTAEHAPILQYHILETALPNPNPNPGSQPQPQPQSQPQPRPQSQGATVVPFPLLQPTTTNVENRTRTSEKAQARQAALQRQMQAIQNELAQLEGNYRSGPSVSASVVQQQTEVQPATQGLSQPGSQQAVGDDVGEGTPQQIEHMRREIDRLHMLLESAWAQGTSDEPPPGYVE